MRVPGPVIYLLFPVKIPKALQVILNELVKLGGVPKPTVTVAEWRILLKKVAKDKAASPDGAIYGYKTYEMPKSYTDPIYCTSIA